MHKKLAALEIRRIVPETTKSLRSAVRFPLALPVHILVAEKQYEAVTDNISANGVLLRMRAAKDCELLTPGTAVEFLIEIPEGTIAPNEAAAVHCSGRVIRSYGARCSAYTAAVIDEYSFQ